jgi:hypothetical protein
MINNYLKNRFSLILLSVTAFLPARAQWVLTSGPSAKVYSMISNNTQLLAGSDSGVYLSSNGGLNWTQSNSGLTDVMARALVKSNGLLVVGIGNTFSGATYTSANNGASWSPATSPYYGFLFCMATKGTDILIGTWYGVSVSQNNGSSWTTPPNTGLPSNATVTALAVNGSDIIAGVSGSSAGGTGVFISSNNGSTWTAKNNGLTNTMVYALAVNGTSLFAGTNGGVFRSVDNGSSWTAANNGITSGGISSLVVNGPYIFAGTSAGIFASSDNGSNWTNISSSVLQSIPVSSILVDGTFIYAGTGNGIYRRPLSEVASVGGTKQEDQLSIYPNPVNDILHVDNGGLQTGLIIMDQLSRKVYEAEIPAGVQGTKLNLQSLPAGAYYLQMITAQGISNKKIIIR